MLDALISLLVVTMVVALGFFVVSLLPVPQPSSKATWIIAAVVFLVWALYYLVLPLAG